MECEFVAELWLFPGKGGWCFLSLPTEVSDAIDDAVGPGRRGFGSVRVEVTVGDTTWRTSIFPDTTAGTFVLPVKRAIRRAEGLTIGDQVGCRLQLLDSA